MAADPKDVRILSYKSRNGSLQPVSQLIFDLDNTLYPAASSLSDVMHQRMSEFVAGHLGIGHQEAEGLRKMGFQTHGTTLRWLQVEKGLDNPEEFLEFVHPENVGDFLETGPHLRAILTSLSVPKSILTNAPRSHAERVLAHLGIRDCFDHIFDVKWNNYEGKPNVGAYSRCMEALGSPVQTTVFIDDLPAYLKTFDTLGGLCILVDEKGEDQESAWPRISSIFNLKEVLV